MKNTIAFISITQKGDKTPVVSIWTKEYQKAFSLAIDRKYEDTDHVDHSVKIPEPYRPNLTPPQWAILLGIFIKGLAENPRAFSYTATQNDWETVPTRRIILHLNTALGFDRKLWPVPAPPVPVVMLGERPEHVFMGALITDGRPGTEARAP